MNVKVELAKLLNQLDDLDQEAYILMKDRLQEGVWIEVTDLAKKDFFNYEKMLGEKYSPLLMDVVLRHCFKILNPNSQIRKNCNKFIIFEDEDFFIDLKVNGSSTLGIRHFDLKEKVFWNKNQSNLQISRFFIEKIKSSNKVEFYIKVNFNSLRKEMEDKAFIYNTNAVANWIFYQIKNDLEKINSPYEIRSLEILQERMLLWEKRINTTYQDKVMDQVYFSTFGKKEIIELWDLWEKFTEDLSNNEILLLSPKTVRYIREVNLFIDKLKKE